MNGNIAEYSINVTSAGDVAAGVKFAQEKNIRLVIKNTGHEYDNPKAICKFAVVLMQVSQFSWTVHG